MWQQLLEQIEKGDRKALARTVSFVENEQDGYLQLLSQLPSSSTHITGITGPPGAGKSTIADGLIGEMVNDGKKVAVICIDPSSPFHLGSLLGDRIRMSRWYTHPDVFIRSLATRGSVGGLNPKTIEVTELVKAAGFDHVIIETVGVGQSEVDIAGLADTTVVVMVPEGGDEIQTMKSGLMEIADIFVVNKSDRPGADVYVKYLRQMLAPSFQMKRGEIPILKTVANSQEGLKALYVAILKHQQNGYSFDKKSWLFTERILQLIQKECIKNIDRNKLRLEVEEKLKSGAFNLFKMVQDQR
jgi:LAO/AO transport system kinase